jgi:hypothetical protein
METEYFINHIPFKEFAKRNKREEYEKYLGYDMYEVTSKPILVKFIGSQHLEGCYTDYG